MKCIFMYNPVGGKGKMEKHKPYIVEELKKKYEVVDEYATKCAGDMTRAAKAATEHYDVIVFAGGDGTFNEVLQGIAECEKQPILGYIPSGTVNDVAHTMKIPSNIKKALKVIKTGKVESFDCMKVNDRYSIYVVAAGAFTSATYNTPQIQKNHVGKLAYGLEGIKHNLNLQTFHISCKGEGVEINKENCVLVAFINSKYVAGFRMNNHANLQDGEMEVAIVEQRKKRGFFRRAASFLAVAGLFLFGYRAKLHNVTHLKGKAFEVCVDEDVVWNIDGERGMTGKMCVEVVPKKVKVIVPNK